MVWVMQEHVILNSALPEPPAEASATEWLHLVPNGTFRGVDGRGPWRVDDAQAVITNSLQNGPLPIDENHSIDFAIKTGQPSPAVGWITEMQSRTDGIYAQVHWTPAGQKLRAEKAYKGISPVFSAHKSTGVVSVVVRAALTNTPNLAELHTLNSQQETQMDIQPFRDALGLPAAADEAAILAAVRANAATITRHSAEVARIAAAAGSTVTGVDELVTVLNTQRAASGDLQKMAGQVVELQTQLGALQGARAKDAATAFIDNAIKAGKPVGPLRDYYITRHAADPAAVEKEVNALPGINTGGMTVEQVAALNSMGGGDGDFSATDAMACQKMGITKEKFIANRAKMRAQANGGM